MVTTEYARLVTPLTFVMTEELAIEIESVRKLKTKALQARYRPIELPNHPRPWMAVQSIAVEDLERLAEVLRRRGHAPVEAGGRYLLPPEAANGCVLEFVAT